ncbi:MAG: hypothetical protein AVDCRST_MAG47-1199, partial [uncultured Nocardioidaceae bacterium]
GQLRHRAHGHVVRGQRSRHRRPGRREPGHGEHHVGGPAGRLRERSTRPLPHRDRQQPLRLAGDPAGHRPPLARRPAEARAAPRPGDRHSRPRRDRS